MFDFSWLILPVVVQVTLLACFLYLIYFWGVRRNAAKTAKLISFGTILMLVLCAAIVLPLPSWFQQAPDSRSATSTTLARSDTSDRENRNVESEEGSAAGDLVASERKTYVEEASAVSMFLKALIDQHSMAGGTLESKRGSVNWLGWFGYLLILLSVFGIVRLTYAIVALQKLKRSLVKVDSSGLHEMIAELQAELDCRRQVAVCHSPHVVTAATIGWRRPIILLSSGYKNWNQQQLKSVLSHELAHIVHNDFPGLFLSKVCAAVHFYNPLVHSLIAKMRLAQEIAADSVAAKLTKDRESYVRVLAEMALNQDDKNKVSLVPLFLPCRQTSIRRIQMLRNHSQTGSRQGVRSTRFGLSALLLSAIVLSAAIAIAGIRVPTTQLEPGVSAETITENNIRQESGDKASLEYVATNSDLIMVFRPAMILEQELVERLVTENYLALQFVETQATLLRSLTGLDLTEIDQVTICQGNSTGTDYLVIQTRPDNMTNFESLPNTQLDDRESTPTLTMSEGQFRAGLIVDEHTVVWAADNDALELARIAGKENTGAPDWRDAWNEVASKPFVVIGQGDCISQVVLPTMQGLTAINRTLTDAQVADLFDPESLVLAADIGDKVSLTVMMLYDSARHATQSQTAMLKLKDFLKSLLPRLLEQAGESQKVALNFAKDAVDNLEIEVNGNTIRQSTWFEIDMNTMDSMLADTQAAAIRTRSANNIRQAALAMHSYHDNYGRFPTAVMKHESGKTYSWRVAVLPFVGQHEMYANYRFDEDWNSTHNLSVTAVMPEHFRHPSEKDGTNTAYFAVIGPGTCMAGETGISLDEIAVADGVSNTVLFVEAKRDIYWTMPEDISMIDAIGLKLGGYTDGGFNVALTDASVNFLPDTIAAEQLKAMLTWNGGENAE